MSEIEANMGGRVILDWPIQKFGDVANLAKLLSCYVAQKEASMPEDSEEEHAAEWEQTDSYSSNGSYAPNPNLPLQRASYEASFWLGYPLDLGKMRPILGVA